MAEGVVEAIFVKIEEWDGLYIDGQLVGEGDSMSITDELEGKTIHFTIRRGKDADENYVQNVGGFPETFDELLDNEHMWNEDNK